MKLYSNPTRDKLMKVVLCVLVIIFVCVILLRKNKTVAKVSESMLFTAFRPIVALHRGKAKPSYDGQLKRSPESEDVSKRYREVRWDIFEGDYEIALEKLVEYYTWTLENDYGASAGVRSSFGLDRWKELVSAYPPAAEKLREMRDHLEELMRTTPMSEVPFDRNDDFFEMLPPEKQDGYIGRAYLQEICNYNEVLGTPQNGVDFLMELAKDDTDLAIASWRGAENVLYATKFYDLLSVFIPNIEAEYERNMKVVRSVIASREEELRNNDHLTQELLRRNVSRLLDFGAATGQTELVQELARKTVEEFPVTEGLFNRYLQDENEESSDE